MNKSDCFESERLIYSGICEQDTDYLVKWRSDPELIKFFRNPNQITVESHLTWYKNSYLPNEHRYDFIVSFKEICKAIGYVGLSNVNRQAKSCEIFYAIGEKDFQKKGFATEAILTVMKYARKMGLVYFEAVVHRNNIASICTIEKLGYIASESGNTFEVYRYP